MRSLPPEDHLRRKFDTNTTNHALICRQHMPRWVRRSADRLSNCATMHRRSILSYCLHFVSRPSLASIWLWSWCCSRVGRNRPPLRSCIGCSDSSHSLPHHLSSHNFKFLTSKSYSNKRLKRESAFYSDQKLLCIIWASFNRFHGSKPHS